MKCYKPNKFNKIYHKMIRKQLYPTIKFNRITILKANNKNKTQIKIIINNNNPNNNNKSFY